jgi:hypothetical protein
MARKTASRAGACFLIAVFAASAGAWLVSTWWTVFRMSQFGDGMGLKCGVVFYSWTSKPLRAQLAAVNGAPVQLQWRWHTASRIPPMEWLPWYGSTPSGRGSLAVPLWPVAVVSGIGAAVLWVRSRRPLPGHCAGCGYDLRGGCGVCPECGRKTLGELQGGAG